MIETHDIRIGISARELKHLIEVSQDEDLTLFLTRVYNNRVDERGEIKPVVPELVVRSGGDKGDQHKGGYVTALRAKMKNRAALSK